jgi:hypothetical protein
MNRNLYAQLPDDVFIPGFVSLYPYTKDVI